MLAKRTTLEKGSCALCGRAVVPLEGLCTLNDGARICARCKRALRVRYPIAAPGGAG